MLWQKIMIRLATNPQAKKWMQGSRKMTDLASRFVGGGQVCAGGGRQGGVATAKREEKLVVLSGGVCSRKIGVNSHLSPYM